MTPQAAPRKSNLLSPEVFRKFLEWLSRDDDAAATTYIGIRKKLVQLFVRRGCLDSEDLADTTLDRVAVIVSTTPEKYSNPLALCCGVARKVWLEYLRQARTEPLQTEDIPVFDREDSRLRESEASCLGSCVERLSQGERELILQYHQSRGREKIELRKRMAEQYGGQNKLRVTAHRIRARLNECISNCLERASANFVHM